MSLVVVVASELFDAVQESGFDLSEIAVAQVAVELFEAAGGLDPGMSPCHDAVDAVLVFDVLDDIAGMAQGELQLVDGEGEEALHGVGQGFQGALEMGRLLADGGVLDEVACGDDGESAVQHAGRPDEGFVDLIAGGFVLGHLPEHLGAALMTVVDAGFQLVKVEGVVEQRIVGVALVHDAAPGGPAPDAEDGGEEVVVGGVGDFLVVETGNHGDALVMLVTVEHLAAEGNERGRGRGVVFYDDAFVGQREGPTLRLPVGGPGTGVLSVVTAADVALPVDLGVGDNLTGGLELAGIIVVAGTVLIDEQTRGTGLTDDGKGATEGLGAGEDDEQDGYIVLCGMF